MTGIVYHFNRKRRFGLIRPLIGKLESKLVFFHGSAIVGADGSHTEAAPPEGAECEFVLVRSSRPEGFAAAEVKLKPLNARMLWPEAAKPDGCPVKVEVAANTPAARRVQ